MCALPTKEPVCAGGEPPTDRKIGLFVYRPGARSGLASFPKILLAPSG